jgi:antitoxin VapB
MPDKTAKIFQNGASQAIRLPAEFRFAADLDEVYIRRDELTGNLILSAHPGGTWAEFFALRDEAPASTDFLANRPLNGPLNLREGL